MFCRKCGTELGENARFCKKCGAEVTIRPQSAVTATSDIDTKAEPLIRPEIPLRPETDINSVIETGIDAEQPEKKASKNSDAPAKGSNTKLIIILCICVLLAVGAAAAYVFLVVDPFGSDAGKKTERIYDEDDDQDAEDEDNETDSEEDESDNGEASETDEKASEDAATEQNASVVRQLSDIDEQAIGELFDVATNGLFISAQRYSDRIKTKYDLGIDDDYRCVLSIDEAKDLMTNTLGYEDLDSVLEDNGSSWDYVQKKKDGIHFTVPDCGDYVYRYEVTSIEMSETGNLTVYGYQEADLFTEQTQQYYRLYMVPNENSIWDGFTVDCIEQVNTQHYYLPDVQERVYDIEELCFSETEYRLARNEIFARRGRLFKSEDLQEYFNSQSWYYGMYEEIPESELNTFEKQNIAVLDKYKKMMKY